MEFKFNHNDLIKQPIITICRQDHYPIGILNVTNLVIKPTFCSLSEVTFTCYADSNYYSCLKKKNILDVEGFGLFEIADVSDDNDGVTKSCDVTAYSYEISLNKNTLTFKDDTVFWLYNPEEPDKSLLSIVANATEWSIAHVDGNLLKERRTMSIDNEEIYALLAGDVADAYKCYFVFDTVERKIYCYERDRVPENSGIQLSFRNLVKEIGIKQSSDDVITALTVTGAEGVGINLVNPLGNNVLYDFSYYCNAEPWGLPLAVQGALKSWNKKIKDNQESYANLVSQKRNLVEQQVTLDGELNVLKAKVKSCQDVQAVCISSNNADGKLPEYTNNLAAAEAEVKAKQAEIDANKKKVEEVNAQMSAIVTVLDMKNNFTAEQLKTLKYFTNGSVYENENFVYTDVMTEDRKIEVSQMLYEQGLKVFEKLSHPLYEFTCEIAPFMFSKKYLEFTKNIELGNAVNLEISDGTWVTPTLLQLVIDYDNPDNTTAILSDNFRLINDVYEFSRGYNQTVKASRKTALSASLWDEPRNTGFYSTVEEYINNALNLANQEIINATDQEFTIGSYGLRGKKYISESDTYDDHQIAMTNNVLAFTDDNWQSCKAALGKIYLSETEYYYGLVAEAIVGNIIVGEQIKIMSPDPEEGKERAFIMDSSGAKLNDASLTINQDKTKIIISPEEGFKIQKLVEGSWTDVLSEDTDGNIIAKSIDIRTGTGNIGGWTITSDRLTSPTGDYIASNGTGKLSLFSWDNTSATFAGNIYANNLQWRYGTTDWESMFGSLGNMPGGWLLDASVGAGKRTSEWDTIYAAKGSFDSLSATVAEIDKAYITSAEVDDIIVKKNLMAYDGTFKGDIYVGTIGTSDDNYSRLFVSKEYIDSHVPDQNSMYIESSGNINLITHREQCAVTVYPKLLAKGSLTVGDGGSTLNGTTMIYNLETNNAGFYNFRGNTDFYAKATFKSTAEFEAATDFKEGVGFLKGVGFKDGLTVESGRSEFRELRTIYNDFYWDGVTGHFFDKDNHRITVVNGLIVSLDGDYGI